ncbi:TRAP transporter large permease [Psychrobacter sp. FDAARGOS_221]|uniref:TRAP transporter large permease n=1 Tax=Psychrobacter sp. FDAARGOS_221 TaxID=1975705 RepID=UPI000BB543B3|nr:TRAP transporter large permease [Psychrobacter sp. FDAARGOS_221]PNK61023.1 TRAP transporter large permease [Psychrobacter sp. FDAARGOS_221]
MSPEIIGAIGLICMILLVCLRVPVALAMLGVGAVGFGFVTSPSSALQMLRDTPPDVLAKYDFSAIPLFILMGVFAAKSGMASKLFEATRIIFGGVRGSLGVAGIGSSGIFASISGSSLATASTMTRVALPEMEKHGYNPGFACGVLAAGGTLGIMIPPSIALLIYAILTEQSVGDMFIAGFLPGILGMVMYSLTVMIMVRWKPHLAQRGEKTSWKEKFLSLTGLIPFGFIFVIIIAGIFYGLFTPTEGAAVGAFVSYLYAVFKGLTFKGLKQSLIETLALSAVVFFMLLGAEALGYFISVSRIAYSLATWIGALDVSPMIILICILIMYFLLGLFMDALAMLVITIPVVYPLILALGYDPVWFGIIAVLTVELGLITPPMGMNIFVIKAVAPHIKLSEMFKGVAPFIVSDVIRLVILVAFPAISLVLVY